METEEIEEELEELGFEITSIARMYRKLTFGNSIQQKNICSNQYRSHEDWEIEQQKPKPTFQML